MNEFIQKEIVKERTGANISPLTVDTQSRFLINSGGVPSVQLGHTPNIPVHKNIFLETLGVMVKEAEEQKLKNNKLDIDIKLKKLDLDLEEKWKPNKERWTTSYEDYLRDFEKTSVEKKKLIQDNTFLTLDEKNRYLAKLDIDKQEDRIRIQETKDKVYIQNVTEESLAKIEQAVDIASTYGINDDKKAKELYSQIADIRYKQKEMTGMTDDKYLVLLGRDIANAETNRISNEISKIMNSEMTLGAKEQKLKEIYSYFDNDNAYNILANEMLEYYKGEDKERALEYLKVKVQGNIKSLIKQTKSSFNAIKKQEKAIANFNKRQREQEEYFNGLKLEDALNERNALEVASLRDKRKGNNKLSMEEFLSNPKYIESVTNLNWDSFGDTQNRETLKMLSKSAIKGIDESRENVRLSGGNYEEEFKTLYETADNISNGNQAIRNNIIKNYGLEKGINPTVLIKGESDPNYFRMADSIKQANQYIKEFGIEEDDIRELKGKSEFKALSKKISGNEVIGDYVALRYLIGTTLKTNGTKGLKDNFSSALRGTARTLTNSDRTSVDKLEKEIKVIKELTTNRIDYRYTPLKDNRTKNQIETTKYQSKFLTEQSEVLGG